MKFLAASQQQIKSAHKVVMESENQEYVLARISKWCPDYKYHFAQSYYLITICIHQLEKLMNVEYR